MSSRADLVVPFLDLASVHAPLKDAFRAAWEDLLTDSAFIGGPAVQEFEAAWASYCEARHAVGVANGTDALTLTLRALGVEPGDEVIVPGNTFIATAAAVVWAGATPRFVDVDPDTLLVTPEIVGAALTSRTAAVIVVQLYGNVPDMDSLVALTESAGIPLIEDAAQAHGATWEGRKAGSFGVAGCFSFYPGKNLGALGDAGAVVTNDDALAERIRSLGNHGRATDDKYAHGVVGTNSRLDAMQAAALSLKLPWLDRWNEDRRRWHEQYRKHLEPLPVEPLHVLAGSESVHHLDVVRVEHRDHVRNELARRGISTGVHYPVPCHRQDGYTRYATGPLVAVEEAAEKVLSLPLYPTMPEGLVERVCEALAESLRRGVEDDRTSY